MVNKNSDVVIVSALRTPFGRYGGSLQNIDYFDLGAIPMREVLKRVNAGPQYWLASYSGASAIPPPAKMFILPWPPARP